VPERIRTSDPLITNQLASRYILLIIEARPVVVFRMDEELILVLRVEGKNGNVLLNYETVR